MNSKVLMAFIVGAVALGVFEFFSHGGALLYSLLFFVLISQGPITIMAAADIVNAKWHHPYKSVMFSMRHMNLFLAIVFAIFFGLNLSNGNFAHIYENWMHGHQTRWLNPEFFGIRNIFFLLLSWLVANKFASVSLNSGSNRTTWALAWVFTYVIGQTIYALDWVMSLQYPWISTLFGAYFFVEAFYSGLAFAAIITYFKYQDFVSNHPESQFKKSQMDMMTLFFGFSVFWAYQFFSQYLVIWYGNIPEEVAFLTQRLEMFGWLLYLVIVIMFLIPFVTLLFRKNKANPKFVLVIGFLVWSGILLERIFMLAPHAHLNPIITIIDLAIMAGVFITVVKNQNDQVVAPAKA
jgi:hypothetical protein